jgi:hypothetical protein
MNRISKPLFISAVETVKISICLFVSLFSYSFVLETNTLTFFKTAGNIEKVIVLVLHQLGQSFFYNRTSNLSCKRNWKGVILFIE